MRDCFSASVKCPFYIDCNVRQTELRCEGITAEEISLRRFDSKEQFKEYTDRFCTQIYGYQMCSYAKMLLIAKYEGNTEVKNEQK